MLFVAYPLDALLMIAMPVALGFFLARRLRVRWGLYGAGALTFLGSQAVHLPLNAGLTALFAAGLLPAPPESWKLPFNAVVLGLTAGLSEEGARYVAYRWLLKSARAWREALMFGAGHGGIEAILLGLLVAVTFVQMVALRSVAPSALPVPPDRQALVAQQVAAYWSSPWPAVLLGALERAFSLCFHLSASIMVLQVFRRGSALWLGAAVLWHAAGNAAAVFAVATWGIYWAEALIGAWAIASLAIVFALRQPGEGAQEAAAAPAAAAPERPAPNSAQADDWRDRLEATRYE